ncbi:MAG: ABC transporter permease [Casimicrobiaceae bacterium]
MLNVLKIALRNLARYGRRTLLTSTLITLGVVAVLLFIGIAGSFKALMIGQFTDGVLGNLEVHRKGYVASIDNLPLNLNMQPAMVQKVEQVLARMPEIDAYSERVKLGAMFSNFTETTSIRVNGVDPAKEAATIPLMPGRLIEGSKQAPLLKPGEILIPKLLAQGLKVKLGDTVVLVATNLQGSVNGKTFVVRGVLDSASGPSGRDGYIDINDARSLLRMTQPEVNEIAIRLKDPAQLDQVYTQLSQALAGVVNPQDKPALEVHTWADLSPFSSIVKMIDLLTLFIKIMLVSIVLVSVLNVMIMAVYERIREIGMISAIGTPPGRILSLFLTEGLLLGLGGTALGTVISLVVIYALNLRKIVFNFGMQQGLVLAPSISARDVGMIVGTVLVIALLASLQPAWKASRMDPVRALGHV